METPVNQTERFSAQVTQLSQLLLRKAQAHGGQIDILSMEIKQQIQNEHLTLLTELVMKATGFTEEMFTKLLADRMDVVIAQLTKETTAPLIALANGMPPRPNGRH
jgi:hypothetical protein